MTSSPSPLQPGEAFTLSLEGLDVMVLRIGSDNLIQYMNGALAKYLGVNRGDYVGHDASTLHPLLPTEITAFFGDSSGAGTSSASESGHVFPDALRSKMIEVRVTPRRTFLDITLRDVTNGQSLRTYVQRYVSNSLLDLTDDDLRTFKFPERRFMSVCFTDLRGFSELCETLAPDEVRTTINAFFEEMMGTVDSNHGIVDKLIGDQVMSLFGAPRYYADHALRAIKTACDQVNALHRLQSLFAGMGKVMPGCGIGLNTGDMVVGNIGSAARQNYTVIGQPVNVAARLCDIARAGEILLTESTLQAALSALPVEWEVAEAESEQPTPELEPTGAVEEILPLPEDLSRKVILLGRNLSASTDNAEFLFWYHSRIRLHGVPEPVTVLAVSAAGASDTELVFDDSRVLQRKGETIFGKYRLLELLGRGGMGEVWKARDGFGNIVAVKTLLSGSMASDAQLTRFKREAEIMSKLPHRNICRIHEVGLCEGVTYLAMEYIPGVSLDDLLSHHGSPSSLTHESAETDLSTLVTAIRKLKESSSNPGAAPALPADDPSFVRIGGLEIRSDGSGGLERGRYRVLPRQQVLSILQKVCESIQYAHEHGVLHRDLKPGNIMIREDGEPVVMDFGLAKLDQVHGGESLTISEQIVGTLDYMSPEQAQSSKSIDERSDVYSLGSILYQMLTGKKCFQPTGNLLIDCQALQTFQPLSARSHNPRIDPDLDIITLKALRHDPNERYRSASAFREDLERYGRGDVILAKPVRTAEVVWKAMKRNRTVAGTIAASVVVILIIGIASLVSIKRQRDEALRQAEEAKEQRKVAETEKEAANEARTRAENEEKRARDLLGQLSAANQNTDTAKSNYQRLAKDSVPGLIAQAEAALQDSDARVAMRAATQATELDPKASRAYFIQAQIHFANFEFSQASNALDNAAKGNVDEISRDLPELRSLVDKYGALAKANNGQLRPLHLVRLAHEANGRGEYSLLLKQQERLLNALQSALLTAFNLANPAASLKTDDVQIKTEGDAVRLMITGNAELRDLSPLGGFPFFNSLTLSQAAPQSLEPLAALELGGLDIDGVPTVDLSPLGKVPLHHVKIRAAQISSLETLKDRKLQELDLSWSTFSSSQLASLDVKQLNLSGTTIKDLGHLPSLGLISLNLEKTPITSLDSLRNKNIKILNLKDTKIMNISGLQGCPLTSLNLENTLINQIDALRRMPLSDLNLAGAKVLDLSPLDGAPLVSLTFTPQYVVRGMEVLAKMPYLRTIRVSTVDPLGKSQQKTYSGENAVRDFLKESAR